MDLLRLIKPVVRMVGKLLVLGWPRETHYITRFSMYKHLGQVCADLDLSGQVLSIGKSTRLCHVLGINAEQVTEANYPEGNILDLKFSNGSFDVVLSDQVFEHIEGNPQDAAAETLRVLKPGGIAIHTTCFVNPIHLAPGDFWRFTPDGLKLLFNDAARVIDAGGWGNPFVWFFVYLGLRAEPIPKWRWHPLHWAAVYNWPAWAIVTWVVAKK